MNWLPPLQLPPFQLPPRLNVAPPRDCIDMCPWPWPCPPPPRRGPALTGDAVNATAANQLKENMSFAFIECLTVLSCFRPSLILNTRKDFWPFFGVHKYTHI